MEIDPVHGVAACDARLRRWAGSTVLLCGLMAVALPARTEPFKCILKLEQPSSTASHHIVIVDAPRADVAYCIAVKQVFGEQRACVPSSRSTCMQYKPPPPATDNDSAPRSLQRPSTAVAPNSLPRSPWLDADLSNGASGPCADAATACAAACGNGRPPSSGAALAVASCKTDCGRQRQQCALAAAGDGSK